MMTISNVTVFTIGVGALSKAVEYLGEGKITEAIISGVIGLAAVFIYERLPLSNPQQ